jgi:GPN-loop GTPase
MVVVFNKVDVVGEEGAGRMVGWIRDFEKFQEALEEEREGEGEESGYMGSLMHSMSLVLDEFYKELKVRVKV